MLYKMIAAALLVSSGEALKLDGMGMGMSRRAAVAKAASLALPLAAMPAFALNRAEDAEIYKVRARCLMGRETARMMHSHAMSLPTCLRACACQHRSLLPDVVPTTCV